MKGLFLIIISILILSFSSSPAFAMPNSNYGGFYKNYKGPVKIVPGGTLQVFKKINEGYTYLIAM
jgi:hypothetical protein